MINRPTVLSSFRLHPGIRFLFVLTVCSSFVLPDAHSQTPELLKPGLQIDAVRAAEGVPVRIDYDQSSGSLFYLTISGDIFEIPPPFMSSGANKVYSSADHGIAVSVLGFAIADDGTMFVVGSRPQGSMTRGVVARGTPNGSGGRNWTTVAETALYPPSGTQFDHNFNGIAVSPDGQFLYVNSGSRTDHGEIQNHSGQFPDTREIPLTSAVFRIPANATDLILPADEASLVAQGYLFADGLRNSFDLAFDASGNLFATENSGDRSDSEELNWLREGHHYGFPWRMSTNDTPQQFPGYDPSQDLLLPPTAFAVVNGLFYDDPSYPPPPQGVVFTDPVVNLGPDADVFQDENDGSIKDGGLAGMPVSTFTAHRSPLGLVFDTNSALPGDFKDKAFVLSWTGPNDHLLSPFGDEGGDLLLLDLSPKGDNFETTSTRLIRGFDNPIDAVLVGDEMYVLEFGGGKQIWKVSFPNGTANESLPDVPFNMDLTIFPNPVARFASISVKVGTNQDFDLEIFDTLGRRVAFFPNQVGEPTGLHTTIWDASPFTAGLYFVRASGTWGSTTKPLTLID